jgi:hypothetical protein
MADTVLQPLLSENNANADLYNVNITKNSNANRSIFDNRNKYFDTFKFNKDFDDYIVEQTKSRLKKQEYLLNDLNEIENNKPSIYNLSLIEILKNTQNMWIQIFKGGPFKVDYYFYVSITLIIILIIYIFVYYIFYNNSDDK